MPQCEPFSVPDDLADGWDDMVRRNRLIQALNDPDGGGNAGDAPPTEAPVADYGVSQANDQVGPVVRASDANDGADLETSDWMPWRALQVAQGAASGRQSYPGSQAGTDGTSDSVSGGAMSPIFAPSQTVGGLEPEFGGDAARGSIVPRRIDGQGPESPTSENPVARWAESHVGRGGYSRFNTAPDAGGRNAAILSPIHGQGWGEPKCNQFVWDALAGGGAPAGRMRDGRIPVAKDWGDPGSAIPGYSPVTDGSAQAGDVISNGHHVGIFAPLADGSPGSVSAASPLTPDAWILGGVVHNGWGFRGDEGNVVSWRRQAQPGKGGQ
jgi:hypothetical protein